MVAGNSPAPSDRIEVDRARCEVCRKDFDESFQVIAADEEHTFDSFECAAHKLAPVCEHCGCRVLGYGVEVDGRFYC